MQFDLHNTNYIYPTQLGHQCQSTATNLGRPKHPTLSFSQPCTTHQPTITTYNWSTATTTSKSIATSTTKIGNPWASKHSPHKLLVKPHPIPYTTPHPASTLYPNTPFKPSLTNAPSCLQTTPNYTQPCPMPTGQTHTCANTSHFTPTQVPRPATHPLGRPTLLDALWAGAQ